MYLQLADGERSGYTFVPYNESDLTKGSYVRNDLYQAALNYTGLNEEDQYLSGFFGSLWNGIKKVAGTVIGVVTGNNPNAASTTGTTTPAVTVNLPNIPGVTTPINPVLPPPTANDGKIFGMDKQTAMLVGGALALFLIMKKR